MFDLNFEIIGVSLLLAIWLGRMSKGRKLVTIHRDIEKIVERKVEVPTVVYKCQHDCVNKSALAMYDKVTCDEWNYDSTDELNEMETRRAESMEKCLKMAMELHNQKVPA